LESSLLSSDIIFFFREKDHEKKSPEILKKSLKALPHHSSFTFYPSSFIIHHSFFIPLSNRALKEGSWEVVFRCGSNFFIKAEKIGKSGRFTGI
jgi:hypothetical protein